MATGEDKLNLPKQQPEAPVSEDPFRAMAEMFHKISTKEGKAGSENLQMLQKQMIDFLRATKGLPEASGDVKTEASDQSEDSAHAGDAVPLQVNSSVLDTRFYKLPTFSGEHSKGESSFELWRYDVQCLIDARKNDEVIRQSIRRSLRGPAAETVMRLGSSATSSQILAKLRSLYGIVDLQETLLEDFYSAHQSSEESVTDWACRLEGLLTRADPSLSSVDRNKRLHNKFWSGLRQDLREVSGHKADAIEDFEELCIAVRSIERSRHSKDGVKVKPTTAKSATSAPAQEDEVTGLKTMVNQLTAAIKSLEKKFQEGPSSNAGYRPRGQGYTSRGRGRGYGAGNQSKPNVKCWRCNQWGHIKVNCKTVLPDDLNEEPPTPKDQR
ncbi:uncharacterized protein LOC117317406 [Pecten maximus]|uniref:uncharacterized protein LOC117317406 n=1 Tax=Pecten maximus TaxID=6579 RepID=UPI001457F09E|nr:uncharacterized protein LOC117317406 [Pecten maximus]